MHHASLFLGISALVVGILTLIFQVLSYRKGK